MELYDVGMSSMVAMELKALANLSITAFDPPRTQVFAPKVYVVFHTDTYTRASLETQTQAHVSI